VFRSIRFRLAASYAALILLCVSIMGTLALTFLQRSVDRQEEGFLQANARAVELQARRFLAPPVRRIALEELARTSAFLGNSRVRILDPDGGVLADSGDPGLPDEFVWLVPSGLAEIDAGRRRPTPFILSLPPRPPGGARESLRDAIPFLRDLPLGTSHLYARRRLTPWGRVFEFEGDTGQVRPPLPPPPPPRRILTVKLPVSAEEGTMGTVELSSPLSLQSEALDPVRGALVLSGLGSLAVAIAFGLLIGRTITDPLSALSAAARRMAGGDLGARAPGKRQDEMGALGRQFNAMAESLEASFRQLRAERDTLKRFAADASHELRTPITALTTFTELLQGSAAEDPAARAEFLEESRRQLARLGRITDSLLSLSRLDAGIAFLELETHDARQIALEAVAGVAPGAREKGIAIETSLPAPDTVLLTCDREKMVRALSNLAANAVKFTPEGGRVVVSAAADGPRVRFSVEDSGPGVPPEDQPRIFERFYRGRNSTGDGAGLGLAIVRSVAEAHGGTARAVPGAGGHFVLEAPLAGPPGNA
jgi:signal transduction histidine kinase